MAFLRMNNPGKKELAACVKQMALVSSKKVRRKKTTSNFMNVLHEYYVGRYRKIDMGEVEGFDFSLSEFTDNKTGDDD
jgi:hypothetical protein